MENNDLIRFSPPTEEKRSHLELSKENNQCNRSPISVDTFIKIDSPSKFSYFNLTDEVFTGNLDLVNSGRESLLFNVSGRESLGILKLDKLNPNILHTPTFENDLLNSGRESLGILKLDKLNTDIVLTPTFENNLLDTAFLYPSSARSQKFSYGSSNLSTSVTPSHFNSASLEGSEPSKILTPSFTSTSLFPFGNELLNDAFITTKESFQDLKFDTRPRIFSLPNMNKGLIDWENAELYLDVETCKSKCKSDSELINVEMEIVEEGQDDVFSDDFVLIEAHHLTAKFEDGSILCDSIEENDLDSTAPPEFPEIDEELPVTPIKRTSEVFRFVDKLIPQEAKLKYEQHDKVPESLNDNLVISLDEEEYENTGEGTKNFVRTLNDKLVNQPSTSLNSQSGGKNPKEILHDLSVIINNKNRDSRQSIEGQQLLLSLADLLCSGSSKASADDANSLDDSGHSSFVQDEQLEDLKIKSCKSNEDNMFRSDMKDKASHKRLSQSFQFSTPFVPSKLFDGLRKKICSTKSLDFDKDGSESIKLKPKKIEDRSMEKKKGPLKALIPFGDMSKKSESVVKRRSLPLRTPSKKVERSSSLFKNKRTSTPVADPQIKPMAQSTPDGTNHLTCEKPVSCSSQLKKRKFVCPVSPLAGPNSLLGDLSGKSLGSTPNSSINSSMAPKPSMLRRYSETELKCNTSNTSKLKRTSSISRNYKVQSEVSRLKENLSSALAKVSPKSFIRRPSKSKNILQERNSGNVPKPKNVFNPFKERRSDKENSY